MCMSVVAAEDRGGCRILWAYRCWTWVLGTERTFPKRVINPFSTEPSLQPEFLFVCFITEFIYLVNM